jgi:hypothetical protein
MMDGTALERTERYTGYGQGTPQGRIADTLGQGQEIEGTVYGWNVLRLIDAATKIHLQSRWGSVRSMSPMGLGRWSCRPIWRAIPGGTTSSLIRALGMSTDLW